ncbi:MAG: glycosyltransferase family 2 protein [Puniceicoccaceae bacterium]
MPKVSILIPCYNNAGWIEKSIEAALSQSVSSKEVIVLDDGSTDDSLNKIQSFGDRIKWETGPNRGGNVARNRLLEMASGEWVQYLDADDSLEEDKVSRQLEAATEDVDAVYGSVTVESWRSGELVDRFTSTPARSQDVYSQWLDWKLAQTGSVLWRTESLRSIGGWNEDYACCQDNEICLRALQKGLVFRQTDDSGAIYRLWSSGTVSKKNPERLLKTKTALIEEMLDWLESSGRLLDVHRIDAGKACFQMARLYAAADIDGASDYYKGMMAKGIMYPDATVAPPVYRALLSIFGFKFAEKVAKALRRSQG